VLWATGGYSSLAVGAHNQLEAKSCFSARNRLVDNSVLIEINDGAYAAEGCPYASFFSMLSDPNGEFTDLPFGFYIESKFLTASDTSKKFHDRSLNIDFGHDCSHNFTPDFDVFSERRPFIEAQYRSTDTIVFILSGDALKFYRVDDNFGSMSGEKLQSPNGMLFFLNVGLGDTDGKLLFGNISDLFGIRGLTAATPNSGNPQPYSRNSKYQGEGSEPKRVTRDASINAEFLAFLTGGLIGCGVLLGIWGAMWRGII
jgi:hypothetical protein